MTSRIGIAGLAALAVGLTAARPARAQGFMDFLRNSGSTAYAPAPDQIEPAKPVTPLSIVPASPASAMSLAARAMAGPRGRRS